MERSHKKLVQHMVLMQTMFSTPPMKSQLNLSCSALYWMVIIHQLQLLITFCWNR
jgi:hypothetical protein